MKRWFVALAVTALVLGPNLDIRSQAALITRDTARNLVEVAYKPLDGLVACDWSPDGRQLAAAGANGVFVVDVTNPDAPPVVLSEQLAPALDLTYTPDGTALVVANPNQIQVWDLARGFRSLRLDGAGPVAVSPDSRLLALTDGGADVRLVSIEDGTTQTVMTGHEDRVTDIGFAPTGQYLASSSLDNTLRLWNIETGDQIRFQRSRQRPQLALDINPYASSVASGTQGGIARLLNVTITTESQYTLRPRADVVDVEYTPDGLLLALAGGNSLYLWTMNNREAPVVISLTAPVACLSFNPDASRLLVGAADGLHIFAPGG
jgi:WD40 repeat protein